MTTNGDHVVQADGRAVRLTSLDKVLWPRTGFSKGAMVAYYRKIAPAMLPYLRDRPVTLLRAPEGVDGKQWFQTRCQNPPSWIRTHPVCSSTRPGTTFAYCVIDDLASLLWAVNAGAIEFHPLLWMIDDPGRSTWIVFDLDPGPGTDLRHCCRVALILREQMQLRAMESFVKTSGSLGLHVLCRFGGSFADARSIARRIADEIVSASPDLAVATSEHSARDGKVMIDWRQNSRLRSTVAPYSLRAGPIPLVSIPVQWSEIEAAVGANDPMDLWFEPADVLARLGE